MAPAGRLLAGTGEGAGPPEESRAALTQLAPVTELTSRSVCAYFAALLAGGLDRRLALAAAPGRFEIECETGA
jgi:hypothetical protein